MTKRVLRLILGWTVFGLHVLVCGGAFFLTAFDYMLPPDRDITLAIFTPVFAAALPSISRPLLRAMPDDGDAMPRWQSASAIAISSVLALLLLFAVGSHAFLNKLQGSDYLGVLAWLEGIHGLFVGVLIRVFFPGTGD